jgi:hypothetical protein
LVLCKGYVDFVTPSNSTTGSIVKLQDKAVVLSIDLPDFAENFIKTNIPNIYFMLLSGQPAKYNFATNSLSITPSSNYIYKMAYDEVASKLLLLDAGDFTTEGRVFVTDLDYKHLDTIAAGVIPTSVFTKQ